MSTRSIKILCTLGPNTLKKKFRTQNLRSKKLLKKLGKINFKIITDQNEKITYINELFLQKNQQLNYAAYKYL